VNILDEIEKMRIKCFDMGKPLETIFVTGLLPKMAIVHDGDKKHFVIPQTEWRQAFDVGWQPSLMNIPVIEDDGRLIELFVKVIDQHNKDLLLSPRSPNQIWDFPTK